MTQKTDIELLRQRAEGDALVRWAVDEIESLRSQNAEKDRQIEELRKAQEWQPINTANTHKPVLLRWRHCKEPRIGQYIDDERGEGWMCDGDQCLPRNQEDCTHWMPLPTAPRQEVKEQG